MPTNEKTRAALRQDHRDNRRAAIEFQFKIRLPPRSKPELIGIYNGPRPLPRHEKRVAYTNPNQSAWGRLQAFAIKRSNKAVKAVAK